MDRCYNLAMSAKATVPIVLYNTPNPAEAAPAELYMIQGVVLEAATDPVKRWVLKEEHGYWDEQKKAYKIPSKTFLPNDPSLCVSLEEVYEQVEKQLMVRVGNGFRYQMEWDPYRSPFFRKFEIQPDGTKTEYS